MSELLTYSPVFPLLSIPLKRVISLILLQYFLLSSNSWLSSSIFPTFFFVFCCFERSFLNVSSSTTFSPQLIIFFHFPMHVFERYQSWIISVIFPISSCFFFNNFLPQCFLHFLYYSRLVVTWEKTSTLFQFLIPGFLPRVDSLLFSWLHVFECFWLSLFKTTF